MTATGADATALLAQAAAFLADGNWRAAEGSFLSALHRNPATPAAWRGLGEARIRGRDLESGIKACLKALELDRDDLAARRILALGLLRQNRVAPAESLCSELLERTPLDTAALTLMGAVRARQGRLDEAFLLFAQALAFRPDHVEARVELGNALKRAGHVHAAIACYRTALQLAPGQAEVQLNLGSALKDVGRLDAAMDVYRKLNRREPDLWEAGSNLLYCLNLAPGMDDGALRDEHRDWAARHAPPPASPPAHANSPEPERPLRIGYVSADLGRHPVGYFLAPVLAAHDRAGFQAVCFSGRAVPDDMTGQLRAAAAGWHEVAGMTDERLALLVAEERIDILVDLSGHTSGSRLPVFARKPAPVQVAWLGYFHTTGVPAIDHVLMDRYTVPEGAERHFTESVVMLPHTRFCYAPPAYAPAPAPPPSQRKGHVTFGCFNNLAKIGPEVIATWARLLHAVPESRLLLKWRSIVDPAVRGDLLARFAAAGIAADRLTLRAASPHAEMLAEYADVDVALDPWPFGGGLTSCEALWMGVPVVTLPGSRPASRQTLGFLAAVGLEDLAAPAADAYVAAAVGLAADGERRATLRRELRDRMAASPLCDGPGFTRALEESYRTMWRRWCAAQG